MQPEFNRITAAGNQIIKIQNKFHSQLSLTAQKKSCSFIAAALYYLHGSA